MAAYQYDILCESVGLRQLIAQRAAENGLSYNQLAYFGKIHKGRLEAWIRCKRQSQIPHKTIIKIAEILGIEIKITIIKKPLENLDMGLFEIPPKPKKKRAYVYVPKKLHGKVKKK